MPPGHHSGGPEPAFRVAAPGPGPEGLQNIRASATVRLVPAKSGLHPLFSRVHCASAPFSLASPFSPFLRRQERGSTNPPPNENESACARRGWHGPWRARPGCPARSRAPPAIESGAFCSTVNLVNEGNDARTMGILLFQNKVQVYLGLQDIFIRGSMMRMQAPPVAFRGMACQKWTK